MTDKKKPSGSEHRKRANEIQHKISKLPKITNFFQPAQTDKAQSSQFSECTENTVNQSSHLLNSTENVTFEQKCVKEKCSSFNSKSFSDSNDILAETSTVNTSIEISCSSDSSILYEATTNDKALQIINELKENTNYNIYLSKNLSVLKNIIGEKYPTDFGHYPAIIEEDYIKIFIIKYGSCRPDGSYPITNDKGNNRSFSRSYYNYKSKGSVNVERKWLCYSPKLDKCYCEPCWLFALTTTSKNVNEAWTKGINKWKLLSEKIKIHEKSLSHLESCIIFEQWYKEKSVDDYMLSKIKKEANVWRKILHRLLNVTLTLATCNLPFRGHKERIYEGKAEEGNFLSIVQLLATYDPILSDLLNQPSGSVRYLSPTIQNELIQLVSKQVETDIFNEIRNAHFFSIILDSTQDVTKHDQLSLVFRYVLIKKNENKISEININEVFTGFYCINDHTAFGLENFILNLLEEKI